MIDKQECDSVKFYEMYMCEKEKEEALCVTMFTKISFLNFNRLHILERVF